MDVLSIGNSFSEDAQRYLHQIAKADGFKLNAFNLYIGGCPLSSHYRNMLSEQQAYTLMMNGESTNFKVSLKEALLNRSWDIVTVQQASYESADYSTYQPYLNEIAEYVKICVPKARLAIHQTWAYEQDSYRLNVEMGYKSHTEMFECIKAAYQSAAGDINADLIIPSGEVIKNLAEMGVEKVHRDTLHAGWGLGRYAIGLLWYMTLTGNDVKNNTFSDFDEMILPEEIEIAKKCAAQASKKYHK